MAIWTILVANIKKRKGSFASIFILIAIISIVVSTVLSSIICGKKSFENANKEANSPEIMNFVLKKNYDANMKKTLEKQDEISKVEENDVIGYENLIIGDKEDKSIVFLCSYEPEMHSYKLQSNNNKTVIPNKGEIYLPYIFKDEFKCKVGMNIEFKTEKGDYSYKVADFFEDPIYGSKEIGIKRFLMNPSDFSEISKLEAKEFKPFISMNTFINDSYKNQNISKVIYNVNQKTGIEKYGAICSVLKTYESYTLSLANIIGSIILGFCILLFIIVIIVIGHCISSSIEMDYASLGIMKAIGFTDKGIRVILLIQYLLSSVLGGIVGGCLSIFLINPIGNFLLTSTGLFWSGNIQIGICLGILGLLLLVLTVYTFLLTRKITKISPVRAIAFGNAPIYFSSRINISLSKLAHVPLSIKIALKQILTHLKQYIRLFIIVGVVTSSIIAILSMEDMFKDSNAAILFGKIKSDISISYGNKEDKKFVDEIVDDVEKEDNITEKFRFCNCNKVVDDDNLLVKVVADDSKYVLPDALEGRNPKYNNEVVITKIMSDVLQKSVGDTIVVENGKGAKEEYMIVGLNQNMNDAGKNITMLESGMQRLEPNFTINTIELRLDNKGKVAYIVEKLKDKYEDYKVTIKDEYNDNKEYMQEKINTVHMATKGVYFIAIIVIGLVFLLVCNNTLQKEKIDIGILKAEGFTTRMLRTQFIIRFLIVALVGSLLGIGLNLLTNNYFMSLLFKNVGITKFVTVYYVKTIVQPVAVVCIFTCVFAWIVTRKIKKITSKNLIQE